MSSSSIHKARGDRDWALKIYKLTRSGRRQNLRPRPSSDRQVASGKTNMTKSRRAQSNTKGVDNSLL